MQIFIITFLILCLRSIDSIELKCQFKTDIRGVMTTYECRIENQGDIILDRSNRTIDVISGSHRVTYTNKDVKVFQIRDSTVFYFPRSLENFFNNLEEFTIINSKLKEIHSEDLKPFKNIRHLSLDDNELQVLEKDLFQFNTKLYVIYLSFNKISHIDSNIFDNFVNKIRILWLGMNICQFDDAHNNKQKVNEIIQKIKNGFCRNEEKLREFEDQKLIFTTNQTIETNLID